MIPSPPTCPKTNSSTLPRTTSVSLSFFFFLKKYVFLAALHSMRDLCFLTGDQTQPPCTASSEAQLLDGQGNPRFSLLKDECYSIDCRVQKPQNPNTCLCNSSRDPQVRVFTALEPIFSSLAPGWTSPTYHLDRPTSLQSKMEIEHPPFPV